MQIVQLCGKDSNLNEGRETHETTEVKMKVFLFLTFGDFLVSDLIRRKKACALDGHCLSHLCVFSVDTVSVSVNEGDSVTLHTTVTRNQQDDVKWYFNDTRIAQINGDLSKSCTDVQCNEGTERFRDRLKLDHQTGSLTIMNITNTDSGVYEVNIISSSHKREKIINLSVLGVSAAKRDEVKRKSVNEGESVTFDPGVIKHPNHVMTWYYNEILIAEITGDQSKICSDDQCEERFRDRLKLDHQTGSLTIMNTRTTDSGEYKLKINSHIHQSISTTSLKVFNVSVTASGVSSAAVGGICAAVLLVVTAAAAVILLKCHKSRNDSRRRSPVQQGNSMDSIPNSPAPPSMGSANETSRNENEPQAASEIQM